MKLVDKDTIPIKGVMYTLNGEYELVGELGISDYLIVKCPETGQCFIIK
jgi:hypothetical protein